MGADGMRDQGHAARRLFTWFQMKFFTPEEVEIFSLPYVLGKN